MLRMVTASSARVGLAAHLWRERNWQHAHWWHLIAGLTESRPWDGFMANRANDSPRLHTWRRILQSGTSRMRKSPPLAQQPNPGRHARGRREWIKYSRFPAAKWQCWLASGTPRRKIFIDQSVLSCAHGNFLAKSPQQPCGVQPRARKIALLEQYRRMQYILTPMFPHSLWAVCAVILQLTATHGSNTLGWISLVSAQRLCQAGARTSIAQCYITLTPLKRGHINAVKSVINHGFVNRRTLLFATSRALGKHVLWVARAFAL